MTRVPTLQRLPWLVVPAAVVVLGVSLAGVVWPVRQALREQVLEREAAAVAAVAQLQRDLGVTRWEALGEAPTTADVFDALLDSSRLEGVVALQLFGADGQAERELPALAFVESLPVAKRVAQAQAMWHADAATTAEAGAMLTDSAGPWLEVVVPLREGAGTTPEGWVRYWIDGREVAAELVRVDRQLWRIGGGIGVVGVLLLGGGLAWTFARLRRQADDLARANRELLLHAKTAAIGAISAHLLHGLKNPLAGLAGFIADESAEANGRDGGAWQEAVATTGRVRRLVQEVMAVLQDEAAGDGGPVRVAEIVQTATDSIREVATRSGVALAMPAAAANGAAVSGRVAALAGLVLHNLLDNAVGATPSGGRVTVKIGATTGGRVALEVADTGPGLPATVRAAAFAPVTSTKPGGAGVGLALSGQLARHAGGELALDRSDAAGTCFRLLLPVFTNGPEDAQS